MELTFKEVMSTDGFLAGSQLKDIKEACKKARFKYFYFNGIVYDHNGYQTKYSVV